MLRFLMIAVFALMTISANNAKAANVCTNDDGSFVYDNTTTFGNSVLITNPGAIVGGQRLFVNDTAASEDGFCKVLGFAVHTAGTYVAHGILVSQIILDADGTVTGFGDDSSPTIQTLTCKKK